MKRVFQHLSPSGRIGKGDSNGVLDEGRNVGSLSGRDECADSVELIGRKGDGDLDGRHTKYHTMHGSRRQANSPWGLSVVSRSKRPRVIWAAVGAAAGLGRADQFFQNQGFKSLHSFEDDVVGNEASRIGL